MGKKYREMLIFKLITKIFKFTTKNKKFSAFVLVCILLAFSGYSCRTKWFEFSIGKILLDTPFFKTDKGLNSNKEMEVKP